MVFTLAMVENPHVWKRAQADIDALVGKDRLPEFHDRPSLPYVDAIFREVLRWKPVLPLGTFWKAVSLSEVLLNILQVAFTALREMMSIRVTIYPMVCPTCAC